MKETILITQEDRDTLYRIDQDCIRMHVPTPPKMFLNLEVKDADGNVIERYSDRAHSWVRNTWNILASQFLFLSPYSLAANYGPGSLQLIDCAGVAVYKGASPLNLARNQNINSECGFIVEAGNDTLGIVIGTGTSAESFESYGLSAKITNGNTSGKMAYSAVTDAEITKSYDSGTKKMSVVAPRVFNNNSGAEISVSEVGLFCYSNGGGSSAYLTAARDLLAAPVPVPNGGQLTVTYTVELTFPA